ncbi:MAG: hypothetical protein HY815_02750 [Candidatus Riflebacteria bacterium]|nr:hypothetical protein [Candidatus Riflebacteria bacterium]
MTNRPIAAGLAAVLGIVVHSAALGAPPARTPEETYSQTKAALEKAWHVEHRLLTGVIDLQEKALADLRRRHAAADPRFPGLRRGLEEQIRKTEAQLANSVANRSRREREVVGQIEEASAKLRRAHEALALGAKRLRADVEARLREFQQKVVVPLEELQASAARVAGRYRVRYELDRIETNLGGHRQTVTLDQLRKLHLGNNRWAPPVPPQLVDQLAELPTELTVEASGVGFAAMLTRGGTTGKLPGVIDYKQGKFLGGGSGGAVITALGTLLHTLTIDGTIHLANPVRFSGRLVSALSLWTPTAAGGLYVLVPFEASKY